MSQEAKLAGPGLTSLTRCRGCNRNYVNINHRMATNKASASEPTHQRSRWREGLTSDEHLGPRRIVRVSIDCVLDVLAPEVLVVHLIMLLRAGSTSANVEADGPAESATLLLFREVNESAA